MVRSDTHLVWEDQRVWERDISIGRTQGRSGGDAGGDVLVRGWAFSDVLGALIALLTKQSSPLQVGLDERGPAHKGSPQSSDTAGGQHTLDQHSPGPGPRTKWCSVPSQAGAILHLAQLPVGRGLMTP